MQYTILGFQQQTLIDLGLDIIDAVLLRWFVDFYHTDHMEKTEHGGWVKYSYIQESLPILRFKDLQTFSYRFEKLVRCGLLKKKIIYIKNNKKGTYVYLSINEKIYGKLIREGYGLNRRGGTVETVGGGTVETVGKDSSINDSSIRIIRNVSSPPAEDDGLAIAFQKLFEDFWRNYPALRKGSKQQARKAWQKLFAEYKKDGEDEFVRKTTSGLFKQMDARELHKKHSVWMEGWPHASTWLNQRRWEDDVITDEKLIKQQKEHAYGERRER